MRSPTSPAMQSVYVLSPLHLAAPAKRFFTHFCSGCSLQGLNNESRTKSGRAAADRGAPMTNASFSCKVGGRAEQGSAA